MSLTFGGATSDRVDCGSAASVDDLFAADASVWAWVYRTGTGDNQYIMAKHQTFPQGFILTVTNASGGEGSVQLFLGQATTRTSVISNSSNVVAANTWTFVAATYNSTAKTAKLYLGTLATPAAEVSGYFQQDTGVGAPGTDAAANLYLGNGQIGGTANAFKGRIAVCGAETAELTVGQLIQQQYRPKKRATTAGLWVLGENGTSTQADKSGNGNNGTVTGATVSDHVPIPRLFGV